MASVITFPCQFFVLGKFFGAGRIGPPKGDYTLGCPSSRIGYCDFCGRECYRVLVQGSNYWRAVHTRCESCPPRVGAFLPGSIFTPFDYPPEELSLEDLPEALISREADLIFKNLENLF